MKIYQVIIQDVWNNLYLHGFFATLRQASLSLSEEVIDKVSQAIQDRELVVKNKKTGQEVKDTEVYRYIDIPDTFLKEYPGTLDIAFDRSLTPGELVEECFPDLEIVSTEDFSETLDIRGFILDTAKVEEQFKEAYK